MNSMEEKRKPPIAKYQRILDLTGNQRFDENGDIWKNIDFITFVT